MNLRIFWFPVYVLLEHIVYKKYFSVLKITFFSLFILLTTQRPEYAED